MSTLHSGHTRTGISVFLARAGLQGGAGVCRRLLPVSLRRVVVSTAVVLALLLQGVGSAAATELFKARLEVPEKFRKGAFSAKRFLFLPKGFRVSVFAAGLSSPRFMAVDANGVIHISLPHEGAVAALPDIDRDGVADRVVVVAKGLDYPHGLAFVNNELIVAQTGALLGLTDKNADMVADTIRVISNDIPAGGGHRTRTVVAGLDGRLYVSVGSSCNVCEEDDARRASVLVFSEGEKADLFARGLRNSVGVAFHPDTRELWGVDNGRDWLGDDLPPEELNRIVRGGDYGWPYCYGNRTADPDYGSAERCAYTIPPALSMQAHSAPLGIAFGKGLKFPPPYTDGLFIAFHGSWNRSERTGYKLVTSPFNEKGPVGGLEDFMTGFAVDGRPWGRPVQPLVGKDGALYLSDDLAGAVYRITFDPAHKGEPGPDNAAK